MPEQNGLNAFPGCKVASVDVSGNSTTILTGKGRVLGFNVSTVLSAHSTIFKDGSAELFTTAVSLAVGSLVVFPVGGIKFNTSLVIDPDDSATGVINVYYVED